MKSQIHFEDHEGFQRSTLYLTVAGAGGALLGLCATALFGLGGAPFAPLLLMLGMAGAGIGATAGLLQDRWSSIGIGTVAGALFGGLIAFTLPAFLAGSALWTLLAAAAAGGLMGSLWGSEKAPRIARAVGFALAAVAGIYIAKILFLSGDSPLAVPGVREAATGGVLGLFLSLGGAVGRFRLDNDPVRLLWNDSRSEISGDMKELAGRGVTLYQEIKTRLDKRRADGDQGKILADTERIASETTQRLILLAKRWCSIEESVDNTAKPRLNARLKALDDKVATVKDTVVKAEYSAAADSLRRQLASFDKIDVARERLVARIHRCLTSLEQVSLMLLQLSTSAATDASLGLQPELERLDEMSEEFSWKSLSVDDLYGLETEDLAAMDEEIAKSEAADAQADAETAKEDAVVLASITNIAPAQPEATEAPKIEAKAEVAAVAVAAVASTDVSEEVVKEEVAEEVTIAAEA